MTRLLNYFLNITLRGPEKIAAYLQWLAPLVARLVVGEIFMTAGWGKLQNLDAMIENFTSWGIPFPHILTPFTSGAEFVCGILLMLGLFTRISAGILGVIMIVAILLITVIANLDRRQTWLPLAALIGGAGVFGTRRALNASPLTVLREG